MDTSSTQETDRLAGAARALSGAEPGGIDVRAAMRDLTLHALQSRLLTANHIATVTRAVGQGLADTLAGPAGSVRDAASEAFSGFSDATSKALLALELAAREFADRGGRLSPGETQQLLDEIAALETMLGSHWRHEHVRVGEDLRTRAGALAEHIKRTVKDGARTEAEQRAAADHALAGVREGARAAGDAWRIIGLMASGALLGLSEALQDTAAPPTPHA